MMQYTGKYQYNIEKHILYMSPGLGPWAQAPGPGPRPMGPPII